MNVKFSEVGRYKASALINDVQRSPRSLFPLFSHECGQDLSLEFWSRDQNFQQFFLKILVQDHFFKHCAENFVPPLEFWSWTVCSGGPKFVSFLKILVRDHFIQ